MFTILSTEQSKTHAIDIMENYNKEAQQSPAQRAMHFAEICKQLFAAFGLSLRDILVSKKERKRTLSAGMWSRSRRLGFDLDHFETYKRLDSVSAQKVLALVETFCAGARRAYN